MTRVPWWRAFLMVIVALLGLALAQTTQTPAPQPTPAAERAADAGVQAWLAGQYNADTGAIARATTPEQAVQVLRRAIAFQTAPRGGTTNLALRRFVGVQDGAEVYRYPVSVGDQVLGYEVSVAQTAAGGWQVQGVRLPAASPSLPTWLRSPAAVVVFALASLLLVAACFRPNAYHTWLRRALGIAREQRALFIVFNVLLYGTFALGCVVGATLPAFSKEFGQLLGGSLSTTGIQGFQTNVPTFATGIAVWNFVSGVVTTSFIPGLFLGVPALLVNFPRLLVTGLALAPGASVPGAMFALHLPTILIELQAYIFVTASAVAWLVRWARIGFVRAWRDFAYSLAPALLLIVIGAWYEAFEIIVLVPLVR